jgi:hypothetical protein
LKEDIRPEPAQVFDPERKIELELFLELLFLPVRENAVNELFCLRWVHRRMIDGLQGAVNADARWNISRDMKVAGVLFDRNFQEFLDGLGHLFSPHSRRF